MAASARGCCMLPTEIELIDTQKAAALSSTHEQARTATCSLSSLLLADGDGSAAPSCGGDTRPSYARRSTRFLRGGGMRSGQTRGPDGP